MLDLFDLSSINFVDSPTIQNTINPNDGIKPTYIELPIDDLTNLFSLKSWHNLAKLYNLDTIPDSNQECFEYWFNLAEICRDRVLSELLVHNENGTVILASKLNLALTQKDKRDLTVYRDTVKVSVKIPDVQAIESRLLPMNHKKHRKDTFTRSNYPTVVDNGLEPWEVVINNNLQIRILPQGNKKDPVVASILYRYIPNISSDPTWLKLGVIRLKAKKLIFSSIEINYIQPDIRLRILGLLRYMALIPNEVIKDSNLSRKGNSMFASIQVQELLKLKLEVSDNPTIPYLVVEDLRNNK